MTVSVALDYYSELMVSESESIEYLENGEEFSIPLEENYIYSTIKLIEEKYNKKVPNYKVEIIKMKYRFQEDWEAVPVQ